MTHRRGAVWTERLFLGLVLASLAGTLNLILTMHRRVATSDSPSTLPLPKFSHSASVPPTPTSTETVSSSPSPTNQAKLTQVSPQPTLPPAAAVQVPTIRILAGMTRAIGVEIGAAQEADQRTAKLETARKAAVAESERWKRRELLVKQQVATMSQRAARLEQEASELDAEQATCWGARAATH